MEQEYPFRARGRHGFDREDVINYITQAQQRCNEHLARMEELEAAKNAWYTQAKGMEREKASLVARNRELEEQLERGAAPAGGEWYPADPMLSSFQESQELGALRARCLELEEQLAQQAARQAEYAAAQEALAEAREAGDTLRQELEALRAENAALTEELQERDELPRFSLQQQEEADALRAQLEQQHAAASQQHAAASQQIAAASQQIALLQQENFALGQKLAALESERSAFTAQMPALQEQLTRLAESAEQITSLEAVKTALAAELNAAKQQMERGAQEKDALAREKDSLAQERDTLEQAKDSLEQAKASLEQRCGALTAEIEQLRVKAAALEEAGRTQQPPSEETLRSMVLASFNYSNLYVDNNLKTAQFISEATSRNIGRVSDSATSLLDQLDSIARSFNDTTDGIRRNLASFQRELGTIQSGMNRRLGKDRFAALLEENERLRARLETELLAELSSDEEERPSPLLGSDAAQLPFAEDLPKNYHEYLDE